MLPRNLETFLIFRIPSWALFCMRMGMAAAQTISAGVAGVSAQGGAGFPAQGQAPAGGPANGTVRQGAVASGSGAEVAAGAQPTAPWNEATAMVPVEAAPVEDAAQDQDIDQERHSFSPMVVRLPVELDVMVPVRDFRVRNLLTLEPGQVIESQWGHGEDVPVTAGEIALAWSEFEVIDTQLAVRITRLA